MSIFPGDDVFPKYILVYDFVDYPAEALVFPCSIHGEVDLDKMTDKQEEIYADTASGTVDGKRVFIRGIYGEMKYPEYVKVDSSDKHETLLRCVCPECGNTNTCDECLSKLRECSECGEMMIRGIVKGDLNGS